MKYLYKILRLFKCPHKWKIIKTIDVYENYFGTLSKLPIGEKYIKECKYCGEIRKFKT
jgi:hypothetical protein